MACPIEFDNESWLSDMPIEVGEYLWIDQWNCSCPFRSGIATVYEQSEELFSFDKPDLAYKVDDKILCIVFHGEYPENDGCIFHIQFWRKIKLPKHNTFDYCKQDIDFLVNTFY